MNAMPRPNAPLTRLSLIVALQSQQDDAWREFVKLYAPLLYSWCRRAGLKPQDAAEVLQMALVRVWRGIEQFKPRDDGSFRGWLRVITSRLLADHFRSAQSLPIVEGGSDAQRQWQQIADHVEQSTQITSADTRRLAQRAMSLIQSEFPPVAQQVFEHSILQARPAPEVAAQLEITPDSVRQLKSRILRRLRELLDER